jgi:ABC-type iron transport system FetAB permease component
MGATVIPNMMIRTILGGTDVEQAAKLQIIITFMMAASTTLSCIIAVYFGLWICVDSEQHIRSNCIDTRPHVVRRAFNSVTLVIINIVGYIWNLTMICVKRFLQRRARMDNTASPSEHSALLNGSGSGDMIPGFWLEPPVL